MDSPSAQNVPPAGHTAARLGATPGCPGHSLASPASAWAAATHINSDHICHLQPHRTATESTDEEPITVLPFMSGETLGEQLSGPS